MAQKSCGLLGMGRENKRGLNKERPGGSNKNKGIERGGKGRLFTSNEWKPISDRAGKYKTGVEEEPGRASGSFDINNPTFPPRGLSYRAATRPVARQVGFVVAS